MQPNHVLLRLFVVKNLRAFYEPLSAFELGICVGSYYLVEELPVFEVGGRIQVYSNFARTVFAYHIPCSSFFQESCSVRLHGITFGVVPQTAVLYCNPIFLWYSVCEYEY